MIIGDASQKKPHSFVQIVTHEDWKNKKCYVKYCLRTVHLKCEISQWVCVFLECVCVCACVHVCVCVCVCVHYAGSCCGITSVCRNWETRGATTSGLLRWTWWSPGTVTTVCWGRERSDGEHLIFSFYITLCSSDFFKRKIFSLTLSLRFSKLGWRLGLGPEFCFWVIRGYRVSHRMRLDWIKG